MYRQAQTYRPRSVGGWRINMTYVLYSRRSLYMDVSLIQPATLLLVCRLPLLCACCHAAHSMELMMPYLRSRALCGASLQPRANSSATFLIRCDRGVRSDYNSRRRSVNRLIRMCQVNPWIIHSNSVPGRSTGTNWLISWILTSTANCFSIP